jgi:hypothetical protein
MESAIDPWSFGWDAVVAIGTLTAACSTLILAAVTAWMANETRKVAARTEDEVKAVRDQSKAARDEVEISRAALETSTRPILVAVPPGVYIRESAPHSFIGQPDQAAVQVATNRTVVRCDVPIRNAGNGLALITGVEFRWPDEEFAHGWTSQISATVVAPGELTRVAHQREFDSKEDAENAVVYAMQVGSFSLGASYTDISGGQKSFTLLDVQWREPESVWRVERTELYEPGAETPFASSGMRE